MNPQLLSWCVTGIPAGGKAGMFAALLLCQGKMARWHILRNLLPRMIDHVQDDGWLHRGRLAYDVPKERYADTWALWAHSDFNAWEFILDPITRRVLYEVKAADYAGDLPFEERNDGSKSRKR